jgi:tetrahydromethanopterin S-methyltransferase subunit D
MGVAALISWIVTASGGLYMLIIWLIENEGGQRGANSSRLPLPVISGHALLALTGLATWAAYLFTDRRSLAWASFGVLLAVVLLGVTMLGRWIGVYRAPGAATAGPAAVLDPLAVPAERNFPVPVVLGHGLLGITTVTLVLLTAMGVGEG